MVSSPMLAPRLMPEMIMPGSSSRSPVTARWTQSVGVPLTNRKPFPDLRTESGRSRVSELEAPLRSRSGATTMTSARGASASARIAMPGAKYPSSLLSRMRMSARLYCPSAPATPSVGQPDVVLGKRNLRCARAEQIIQLGELDLPAEGPVFRKAVQEMGHPPGEPFRLPDALQRARRIGVQLRRLSRRVMLDQGAGEVVDVARGEVEALRAGGRHDVGGVMLFSMDGPETSAAAVAGSRRRRSSSQKRSSGQSSTSSSIGH